MGERAQNAVGAPGGMAPVSGPAPGGSEPLPPPAGARAGPVAVDAVGRLRDVAYQRRILEGVSRTFALTIPELPGRLSEVVGNAYLLCRIADTIEDDADLEAHDKRFFSERFIEVIEGNLDPDRFAAQLTPRLSPRTPPAERDLIQNSASVIRLTLGYSPAEQDALARCVRIMARGMSQFQSRASRAGLADLADLDRYCYYVAGVVGEMLTTLFCEHSEEVAARRSELMGLAVSFGQGLQMTNILKDIWDDYDRGACWLPRDRFSYHGFDLDDLSPGSSSTAFAMGLEELIGIAHYHLARALRYTLLIPNHETGIRRFCLWALGMAVLTLRNLHHSPGFAAGEEVKISRRTVKGVVVVTSAAARSDWALRTMFRVAGRGLPAWSPLNGPPGGPGV